MQKLIILDGETGIATIMCPDVDLDYDSVECVDNYLEELGYNTSSCNWLVALEVNDQTK